jgi:hypothetical protein
MLGVEDLTAAPFFWPSEAWLRSQAVVREVRYCGIA